MPPLGRRNCKGHGAGMVEPCPVSARVFTEPDKKFPSGDVRPWRCRFPSVYYPTSDGVDALVNDRGAGSAALSYIQWAAPSCGKLKKHLLDSPDMYTARDPLHNPYYRFDITAQVAQGLGIPHPYLMCDVESQPPSYHATQPPFHQRTQLRA